MITFYYETRNTSSKRAEEWFEEAGLVPCMKKMNQMTREDLTQVLLLSENGFPEILKNKERINSRYDQLLMEVQNLTFNKALDFILNHVELLRAPLIFDYHKLMVGFNSEEIRMFLPQSYRDLKLERIMFQ